MTQDVITATAAEGNPALLDTATGALSRQAFLLRLEEATALAVRLGHPVSLLVIDLLREDSWESVELEAVLAALVDRVWARARRSDTVARLGPGRLAVLLPATDESGAVLYAERLEPELAALVAWNGEHLPERVALTVVSSDAGETPIAAELLEAAERR